MAFSIFFNLSFMIQILKKKMEFLKKILTDNN